MKIEPIIYETTRGIYSVEDKLSIASLILFCWKLGNHRFCEILYTDNHEKFISELSEEYSKFEINLSINLADNQIKNCFEKTIQKVKEKYDSNGYLKALYEKDEYALVIDKIVNYNFKNMEIINFTKNINKQLKIMF